MTIADELLKDAQKAKPKESLLEHREAIVVLRQKGFSWREIAQFFGERGVETDHTKLFRFMQRYGRADMNASNEFFVPDAAQYAEALLAVPINDTQRNMLECHFKAHNRTVTYTQLANAAGFENHSAANSQYGKLGRVLGEKLGMHFVQSESRGEPFYSSSLGCSNPFKPETSEYQLVMHHELAKAIETLGWFR